MGEYRDIKKLVCKLKVAAIDAMMRDIGDEYCFNIEDDYYYSKKVNNRSLLSSDVEIRVKRPNSEVECGSLTSLKDVQDPNEVL